METWSVDQVNLSTTHIASVYFRNFGARLTRLSNLCLFLHTIEQIIYSCAFTTTAWTHNHYVEFIVQTCFILAICCPLRSFKNYHGEFRAIFEIVFYRVSFNIYGHIKEATRFLSVFLQRISLTLFLS